MGEPNAAVSGAIRLARSRLVLVLTVLAAAALASLTPAAAAVRSAAGPAAVRQAALYAVSCPGSKLCVAVGVRAEPHGRAPVAERWNGSSWADEPIPAPGASDAYLVSVSCPTRTDCTAVGGETSSRTQSGPLAEQWNGRRWHVTQASDPAGIHAGDLVSVSCASKNDCVAVGGWEGRTRDQPLSEKWNGRSWKLLKAVRLRQAASFTGVDCTGGFCMAVGEVENSAQPGELAMAEELTAGSWKLVSTPALAGAYLSLFYDAWCRNPRFCLAVGQTQGATNTAIAQMWTGSTWTPQPLSGTSQVLLGISCSSSASCMAVGSGVTRPISQRWTGNSWISVPTAHLTGAYSSLYQVSCPTATRCIAVGARTSGGLGDIGSPLAEDWDGSSWRVLRTVSP